MAFFNPLAFHPLPTAIHFRKKYLGWIFFRDDDEGGMAVIVESGCRGGGGVHVPLALGHYTEAVTSLHRALEIRTYVLGGETHTQVAATIHNLANVHHQAGDYQGAIELFSKCKLLQQDIHQTPMNEQVARACIAMGHVYYEACHYQDAKEAYEDALEIYEQLGIKNDQVMDIQRDVLDLERLLLLFQIEEGDEHDRDLNSSHGSLHSTSSTTPSTYSGSN